jgi:hypothetical protein
MGPIIVSLVVPLLGCAPHSGDEPPPTRTDVLFSDTDVNGHGDASAAATARSTSSAYAATDELAVDADFMAVGSAWSWFATDLDVADADADGVSDLLVGSFVDLAVYVVYGPASGTATTASLVALRDDTATPAFFGSAVGAGDANDDGIDDVLASSSHSESDGKSYLFLGPITADRGTTDADAVLSGPSESLAGCCGLDVVGDFDADGASDIAVGAPGALYTDVPATAYVVTGPTTGAIDLAADAAYIYEGARWRTSDLGAVQRIGDMNADGIDDLALGDWIGFGTLYLIEGGSAPGTYPVGLAASATLKGRDRESYFGGSFESVDYDGDGTLDLVIGAAGGDSGPILHGGGVFAFLGPFSGSLDGRDATARWVPDATVRLLGNDVAVGDVDGDVSADLLFGAPWSGGDYSGAAFLQLGFVSGVVRVSGLPSFRGSSGEYLGANVAIVADWTGDGGDEVALAAPYHRDAAGDIDGAVYAFDSETIFDL